MPLKRLISRKLGIAARTPMVMTDSSWGVSRVSGDSVAFEGRRSSEVLVAVLAVLHCISTGLVSKVVERNFVRTRLKATLRRDGVLWVNERSCMLRQIGCWSPDVPVGFVVIVRLRDRKDRSLPVRSILNFSNPLVAQLFQDENKRANHQLLTTLGHASEAFRWWAVPDAS